MSLVEVSTSVAAGFGLSLAMQALLFPVVGLQATVSQNLKLALGFTALSLARSYLVRRVFERFDARPRGAVRSLEDDSGDRRGKPDFSRATIRTGGRDRLLDEEAR
jgi:membrane protein implicated in regulation of membrane protease activity